MGQILLHTCVDELHGRFNSGDYRGVLDLGDHILRYYPKHLETYLILAQTRLEMGDLESATDLLQRVRSADPENAVAHIGLADIHEREGRVDRALWHLERAFELQPASVELRQELVRLHEACEGAPLEKLKYTQGGLGRLYLKQGMYNQAAVEFQDVLRAEPDRLDLQVALAEALYRDGRREQAATVAEQVLRELPYSVKVNLITGAVNGEKEKRFERALAVDPEGVTARDMGIDLHVEAAPSLPEFVVGEESGEPLVWKASTQPAAGAEAEAAVEPAETAGTVEPNEEQEEGVPGWLENLSETEEEEEPEEELQAAVEEPRIARPDLSAEPSIGVAEEEPPAVVIEEAIIGQAESAAAEREPAAGTRAMTATATTETEQAASQTGDSAPAAVEPEAEVQPVAAEAAPEPAVIEAQAEPVQAEVVAEAAAAVETATATEALAPEAAARPLPALPRVAPVIPGALDKFPAWVRSWLTSSSLPVAQAVIKDEPPVETAAPPELELAATPEPDRAAAPEAKLAATPPVAEEAASAGAAEEAAPAAPAPLPAPEPAPEAAPAVNEPVADVSEPVREEPPAAAPLARENEMPDWLRELEGMSGEPEPAKRKDEVPEWLRDEAGAPSPSLSAGEVAAPAPVTPPVPILTSDAETLLKSARELRASGQLETALDYYEKAMQRGQRVVPAVTADLEELSGVDAPDRVRRLLGDAYAMAGRFQEALAQYRLVLNKE